MLVDLVSIKAHAENAAFIATNQKCGNEYKK
jgi:hypothetical protein